jgi:16S rRNA (guanine527-N7)-methyltransferase
LPSAANEKMLLMQELEFYNLLKEGAAQIDLNLTEEQIHSFSQYLHELKVWGEKMNLTSRSDDREIVIKDFLDSLTVQKQLFQGASLLDLGSGAGFPGIPLKIVRPDLKVLLLEIILKKIHFLKNVVRVLGLEGVEILRSDQKKETDERLDGRFDFVISRALGSLSKLAVTGQPFLKKGGVLLAMKGAKGENELEKERTALSNMGLTFIFLQRFRLPLLGHERVLIGFQRG